MIAGMRGITFATLSLLLVAAGGIANAQPTIRSASGQWDHGRPITIQGSGFGTKATAAPVVWDDSSGSNFRQKWDGGWPDRSNNSNYDLAYRTPIRGINPPHGRVGRYLAGAHGENTGSNAGYNVMFWKTRTVRFPAYTYLSWYQRTDDNWVFGQGDPPDDNFKVFDWTGATEAYTKPRGWYLEYNSRPRSATSSCAWHINDVSGVNILSPASIWGGTCTNPMSGEWVKVEMLVKWTPNDDGFIKVYDNGDLVIDYRGRTDRISGTTRAESVGGYSRGRHPNNWRYFTDVYLDYTLSHVVLGNASTLERSTRREVQIPTSWSASSITISANLGAFSQGENAYLYVVDANGVANAQGHPITIGSGSSGPPPGQTTAPAAPTGLRVVGQ